MHKNVRLLTVSAARQSLANIGETWDRTCCEAMNKTVADIHMATSFLSNRRDAGRTRAQSELDPIGGTMGGWIQGVISPALVLLELSRFLLLLL